MKLDEIIPLLGTFGRYQFRILGYAALVSVIGCFTTLCNVFYAAETDHWCIMFKVPFLLSSVTRRRWRIARRLSPVQVQLHIKYCFKDVKIARSKLKVRNIYYTCQ